MPIKLIELSCRYEVEDREWTEIAAAINEIVLRGNFSAVSARLIEDAQQEAVCPCCGEEYEGYCGPCWVGLERGLFDSPA